MLDDNNDDDGADTDDSNNHIHISTLQQQQQPQFRIMRNGMGCFIKQRISEINSHSHTITYFVFMECSRK